MSNILVVVGATGKQGQAIVQWFQQNEPSYSIRGLSRDLSSDQSKALIEKGVEMVQADFDNVQSLQAAFRGATVIFAYTAFGKIVMSPEVMGAFQAGQLAAPIGKAAGAIEVRQGKNIADAAASISTLERLVWSSLSDVKRWSHGKYEQVYHFDSKADVTAYMLGLAGLQGKVSMVQVGSFADIPMSFLSKTSDGTVELAIPMPPDHAFPWIDIDRDLGAFVNALIQAPAPSQVVGQSETLSVGTWIELWTAHTGRTAHFRQVSVEDFVGDHQSGLKLENAEMMQYIKEYGYTGGDPDVWTPDEFEVRNGTTIPRSKIADHIKRTDWSEWLS